MLTEAGVAKLLAFSQRVEEVSRAGNALVRALNALHPEAVGLELLLIGPAQNTRAVLGDAECLAADLLGALREV